jgi:Fic family protein
MQRNLKGQFITISKAGEKAQAFVPAPLPPSPPIDWSPKLRSKFDQALLALGRLDSVSMLLPETSFFLYMYIRKEAVLSSMIEGSQSSLSDLLLYELGQEPKTSLTDVQKVKNYAAALNYGLKRLAKGGSISQQLIKEIHAVLLAKGRRSHQTTGEFRSSQSWSDDDESGKMHFVPPPPEKVPECLGELELFLHDRPELTPVLLKAALAHVQFETIRPFMDGNGRLGRLLITLLLYEQKVLKQPMLHLSQYFKTHRQYYYDLLNKVRLTGDWESWLDFFSEAVIATATQVMESIQQLINLSQNDRAKISALGRAAMSTLKVHRSLLEQPIATAGWLVGASGLSPASVNKALVNLQKLGIVRELTAKKRNRLFGYTKYVEIMNRGMKF